MTQRSIGNRIKSIIIVSFILTGCTAKPLVREPSIVLNEKDQYHWRLIHMEKVVYPKRLGKKGLGGCVNVSFVINSDGTTSNPVILKAIPEDSFNQASLKAISHYRFEETERNKEKVPIRSNTVFAFTIREGYPGYTESKADYWYRACEVDLNDFSFEIQKKDKN